MENITENKNFQELKEDIANTSIDTLVSDEEYDVQMATEEQKEQELKSNLSSQYGLSDNDVIMMMNIISKRKAGEHIEMRDLPFSMQSLISELCKENKITGQDNINSFAEDVLDNIVFSSDVDAEINNFNNILQEEFKNSSDIDFISDYSSKMRTYYEETILENANKCEEDGELENAEKLRAMSNAFTKSYTYTDIISAYKKDKRLRKLTENSVAVEYDKYCRNYDILMKNATDLIVRPAHLAGDGLYLFADSDISNIDVARFIIVLCKYIDKYLNIVSNKFDSVHAYYLMTHLINLNSSSKDELSDFNKEIIKNAHDFIRIIKSFEEETLE